MTQMRNSPHRLVAWSLAFNLPFVVLGAQRMAFDTYIHIFLADHYFQRWWSLWEPRWYLGFSMASYPPLVHQLIALLARPVIRYAPKFSRFAVIYTCSDFTFTAAKAQKDFGFEPKYSPEEAYRSTVDYYRS